MADQADIDTVKDQIGPNATAEGWDDTKIGQKLDDGLSVDEVTLMYWEGRIARTSTMVDVSENGSSRALGTVFSNALQTAQFYRDRVNAEDVVETVRPVRTRSINRI